MADDRKRDPERTTIVTTEGDGRGSAGMILIMALIAVLVLAVLFFSGVFDRGEDRELNVDTPDVNVVVPQTQVPVVAVPEAQVPPPEINVNVTTPPPEAPADNLSNTENVVTNSD